LINAITAQGNNMKKKETVVLTSYRCEDKLHKKMKQYVKEKGMTMKSLHMIAVKTFMEANK
jgi:hypothetical protein